MLERTGTGEFLNQHVEGGRGRVAEAAETAKTRPGTETTVLDWRRPPAVRTGGGGVRRPQSREAD